MSINQKLACEILRLDHAQAMDHEKVEEAFRKMLRRYPVEQFPQRFEQIREAYAVLSDPMRIFKSMLFDDVIDLSLFMTIPPPLNSPPHTEAEKFVLPMAAALLREEVNEWISEDDDDYDFDDDEQDPFQDDSMESLLARMARLGIPIR